MSLHLWPPCFSQSVSYLLVHLPKTSLRLLPISLSCPVQLTVQLKWKRFWHRKNILSLLYQMIFFTREEIDPVEQLFKDLLLLYRKIDENLIP